ncbi:DegT/DnrJ/EryC1/StrS aminotransferase family protein [[Clostridium] symbiosum]|uniref:DegT/DnrJ/EryC1/StrS family aminotransferase n=1 Tax=Clostridium symbiosum TaxID=1512 RepID=UPI001D091C69|nr:DegT/DnrJ/EryC1/StrS aminotransferase family protein [[Clostridium] symbiosum]MCB6607648.1 DegT/DnrJ/EryC1/StrS aminotransferase family protein [[Clostridium] symbiosum]MCB6929325.1 DegT/DnrJ/EryC1/StrS aminotransferase family protein [[Clostridium] symbiosum]
MEFRDLKKQYEVLKPEIDAAIQNVIDNTAFISGPQVKELEERLAAYTGMKYCITCGNGTDALSMVLMAWDIKEGDAVFVPDFTFFATGEVASFEGATPVFVDVDEDTFDMDPAKLEEAIKAVIEEGKLTPKMVIPVDLFGLPAPYPEIERVAKQYGLKVLEDGAQGFGGMLEDRRACSFGDAATTSFFPAKPLGCYGDGGAIFTNDKKMAEYLESIRVHGKGSYKYENIRIGWNSRLDTLQATIMLPKLKAFKEYELDKVNEAAQTYTELLKDIVKTPSIPAGALSSWAQYTIQLKNRKERDGLQEFLKTKKIPTMVYYPIPMHSQKAFEDLTLYQECPMTEKLCETVLSLPMHPYLETSAIHYISEEIKKYISKR